MIPCQLRPTSPTECGENEEGDDAATEAPTMMENETVVDPNEMEKNWYASRMQEVEEEWEEVKEEMEEVKVEKKVVEEVKKLIEEVKKEMEEEKKDKESGTKQKKSDTTSSGSQPKSAQAGATATSSWPSTKWI